MLHDAFRCPFAQPAHIQDCRDEVPLLPCCVPRSLQSYPAPENSQKWEEIQVWLLQLCLQAGTVYQGLRAGAGGQGEMEEGRAGVGFFFTLNIFWRIVPSRKETVQNSQKTAVREPRVAFTVWVQKYGSQPPWGLWSQSESKGQSHCH